MFLKLRNRLWIPLMVVVIISISLIGCSNNEKSSTTVTSSSTTTSTSINTSTSNPTTSNPTTTQVTSTLPVSTTSTTTTTTETQVNEKEIVNSTTSAWSKLVSYEYDLEMVMNMSALIEGKQQDMVVTITGTGMNNITSKESQMTGNMDMESAGMGKMSMPLEVYLVNGWAYTKISIPMVGEQWIKTKVESNSITDMDEMQQSIEILKTAKAISYKGMEDVEGTSCYVITINPDQALMTQLFKSMMENSGTQTGKIDLDYAKVVKKMSFQEWIAKDSNLIKKSKVTATLELTGEDLGTGKANDQMNMDIDQVVTIGKYNQTFTITLPPESQNAKEMTAQN